MVVSGFDFPDELHYHVEHQVWARLHDDGTATVGITSLGIRLAGDIYMCRPKQVGSVVEAERSIAVVELAKSIVSVKSPVGGTVVEVNARLADEPEWVVRDPYGEGWLARTECAQAHPDRERLVYGAAVAAAMAHHAWLNGIEAR
jgi:glycine cleavage system H protein